MAKHAAISGWTPGNPGTNLFNIGLGLHGMVVPTSCHAPDTTGLFGFKPRHLDPSAPWGLVVAQLFCNCRHILYENCP